MGIDFLASQDLMHGDVSCSKVLLSLRGYIKNREVLHLYIAYLANLSSQPIPKDAPVLLFEGRRFVKIMKLWAS